MTRTEDAEQFFDRYTAALLARDAEAIAAMYAVPALILFPGNSIAVNDAEQTADFFSRAWSQYEGVDSLEWELTVMGESPGSIWADIVWSYDGEPRERFCYQLVDAAGGMRIAVLTPMEI